MRHDFFKEKSCENCGYNKDIPYPYNPKTKLKYLRFDDDSYCSLREVHIKQTRETHCDNWIPYCYINSPKTEHIGLIFSTGFFENKVKTFLPWHGVKEPVKEYIKTCSNCNRGADYGIEIDDGPDRLTFCSNYCYMEFWRSQHGDQWPGDLKFDPPALTHEECQRYDIYRSEPDERNRILPKDPDRFVCGTFFAKLNHDLRSYALVKEGAGLGLLSGDLRERLGDVVLWKPSVLLWKISKYFQLNTQKAHNLLRDEGFLILRNTGGGKESSGSIRHLWDYLSLQRNLTKHRLI